MKHVFLKEHTVLNTNEIRQKTQINVNGGAQHELFYIYQRNGIIPNVNELFSTKLDQFGAPLKHARFLWTCLSSYAQLSTSDIEGYHTLKYM